MTRQVPGWARVGILAVRTNAASGGFGARGLAITEPNKAFPFHKSNNNIVVKGKAA